MFPGSSCHTWTETNGNIIMPNISFISSLSSLSHVPSFAQNYQHGKCAGILCGWAIQILSQYLFKKKYTRPMETFPLLWFPSSAQSYQPRCAGAYADEPSGAPYNISPRSQVNNSNNNNNNKFWQWK